MTIATATLKNVQYPNTIAANSARVLSISAFMFHRAHRALLTDRVLNNVGGDWGSVKSVFSGDTLMSQLREQDHLFTVLEKAPTATSPL